MKKILAIALACVMAFGLVACGGSKIKDGTYSAEMSDASAEESHGWKDYLNITYKDGKIDTVEYDSKDAEGVSRILCKLKNAVQIEQIYSKGAARKSAVPFAFILAVNLPYVKDQ
jgi:major membrane immunogen (membrane-anchored lipoprotein)